MCMTNPQQVEVSVKQYRDTIQFMDGLSQDGFSQIAAIAKLALMSLETPDGHRSVDDIAHALNAIWAKAAEIQNHINAEAENVGCNHVEAPERRRWAALRTAREQGIAA